MKRRKTTARRRRRSYTHKRRRANPAVSANPRRRYARRRNRYARRNPSAIKGVGGLFSTAVYTIFGAVGTRALTQMALGTRNQGVLGYGSNALAALVLGWAATKFGRNAAAGRAVTVGGFVGLTLRLIQDLTPIGRFVNLQLAGMGRLGDTGLGMFLPQSYVDPKLYAGADAQVLVPPAFRPAVAAPANEMAGLGYSTYAASTYRM